MKCLMKYQWVKLPRNHLPEGKGIMNAWAKLASRAAFRKGQASYCGHINAVSPGMWSGGVVGLKSILGSRSRVKSLEALSKLSELGYISYSLNAKTKKLTYQITDLSLIHISGGSGLHDDRHDLPAVSLRGDGHALACGSGEAGLSAQTPFVGIFRIHIHLMLLNQLYRFFFFICFLNDIGRFLKQ